MARRSRNSFLTLVIELIVDCVFLIVNCLFKVFKKQGETCTAPTPYRKPVDEPKAKTKRVYPKLTVEMLPKEPVKTLDAAKFYKNFMLEIGFLDKSEIPERVSWVREEMSGYIDVYQETIDLAKELLGEQKAALKELTEEYKNCPSKTRELIEADIEDLKEEVAGFKEELQDAKDELTKYKSDKRNFLYNHINRELGHIGHNRYPF